MLLRSIELFVYENRAFLHLSSFNQRITLLLMASTSRSGRGGEVHDPFSAIEPPSKKTKSSLTAKQYDVFINHRGSDVKTTLAQKIYDSLQQAGIRAYLDAQETELGDYFPSAIKNAIFSSMQHIAILSPHYAESPWCLTELSLMFQTKARIIPLFYDVLPSDFRYIKNGVSDAFSKHEEKGRYHSYDIQQWKECLQNISGIKGHEINGQNDDLSKLCNDIVSAVLKEKGRRKIPLQVAKYVVGLDELVQDFDGHCRRHKEMRDKIIGIFGMGGSGKTTLAKYLFNNKHSEFSGSTILFDVRENHAKGALTSLQSKFLNDLFRGNDRSFHSVEEGAAKIKHDLQGNRESGFLIVIDDVDHQKQLDALLRIDAIKPNCLVIVTTRDERLLINAGVRVRYTMKEMDPERSRELFCWHAFHIQCCERGFEKLIDSFVQVCAGLPLALQVMGGHVFGSDMAYWKSQLGEVKARLDGDIKDKLKISYDALEEDQKQIFMDIACFFIREDVSRAISIWNSSGWRAEHALQTLKDKCLVQVQTEANYDYVSHYEPQCFLKMHDHLRDLGREMADKETSHPTDNEMSRPRRLWRPEDLIRMRDIKEFQDTLAMSEGKSFRCYSDLVMDCCRMKYFLGSSKTSTDLQWLQLLHYPSYSYFPEWIPLQNLYSLSLEGARPAILWEMDDQVVLKLKELSCSFGDIFNDDLEKLVSSFGRFQNLESLRIRRSDRKFEWSWLLKSVRELTNLQTLRLERISAEGEFSLSNRGKTTDDRFHMRSLEAIHLCEARNTTKVSISGEFCPTLKSLRLCSLEHLIEVDLTGVTTLECLTLNGCRQLEHVSGNDLPNLKIFHIKHFWKLRELPKFVPVSCLKRIYIRKCWNLQDISAIENVKGLNRVWINYCPRVKSIKAIEQLKGLNRIWIQSCKELEDVVCFKELKELKRIFIGDCPSLQSVEGIEFLRCLESIIIVRCQKMKNIRGIEELEGLKEFIISDRPVISCVKRLQRLPSEFTTMVGRSAIPDLELWRGDLELFQLFQFYNYTGRERRPFMSYIVDTLSMLDAFCEMDIYNHEESMKPTIQSFMKTHHPLSVFIFCSLVSGSVWTRSDILYGTRIVNENDFVIPRVEVARSGPDLIYTCVVTENMFSNYDWMPNYIYPNKVFLMGVKAGEERKTLHILRSYTFRIADIILRWMSARVGFNILAVLILSIMMILLTMLMTMNSIMVMMMIIKITIMYEKCMRVLIEKIYLL